MFPLSHLIPTVSQVNVFSESRFAGNAVAVVLDGSHLSSEAMQEFANWTNLAETTFVLPATNPEADYRLRIFTTTRELPFAGHPTLGSCYAWLHNGGEPRSADFIIQECGIGLVKLKRGEESNALSFQAPEPLRMEPMDENDVTIIAAALKIDRSAIVNHSWCDNGPKWRGIMLSSMEEVLKLKPDFSQVKGMDIGVIGPAVGEDALDFDYEVRAFAAEGENTLEDPVTGSLNAALAQWLMRAGLAPSSYVTRQGTKIGRNGRVGLSMAVDGKIWVSGKLTICIDGKISI